MQRDRGYLLDIIEAAQRAISYTESLSKEEFLQDVKCQDAVIRRLEIIGEAARRVSEEMKAKHGELPWHQMIAMRNIMVHEYDDIDMTIVWETVQRDLKALIPLLEKIFSE